MKVWSTHKQLIHAVSRKTCPFQRARQKKNLNISFSLVQRHHKIACAKNIALGNNNESSPLFRKESGDDADIALRCITRFHDVPVDDDIIPMIHEL